MKIYVGPSNVMVIVLMLICVTSGFKCKYALIKALLEVRWNGPEGRRPEFQSCGVEGGLGGGDGEGGVGGRE